MARLLCVVDFLKMKNAPMSFNVNIIDILHLNIYWLLYQRLWIIDLKFQIFLYAQLFVHLME